MFRFHGKVVLVLAACCLLVAAEKKEQMIDLPAQAADAMDERIEPAKLRGDFRIARQALEEGHSGIYRYTSKEELDRLFDQAENP